MSKTTFETDDALTKKAWDEKLFRDASIESYFMGFSGETSDSLVQIKTDLESEQGDQVTFGLRMRLTGAGIKGRGTLEGNEERLTTYNFSVSLDQYRHGVRDEGALDRKRPMFSIDEESEAALRTWGAEKIDKLCFDTAGIGSGATTDPTRIAYPDGADAHFAISSSAATAKAALAATNSKLTLTFVSALKTWAKTGGNRTYIPLRPVKIDGKEYYILLTHPDSLFDLKQTTAFQTAQRDAEVRGPENPLFQGATAIWDGVVIHEHENCAIAADAGGGSNVNWNKAIFMGCQSLVWAWGIRPEVKQAEFDYGNEHGYAWDMICAPGKPKFNSLDFGSIGVYLSRTAISQTTIA